MTMSESRTKHIFTLASYGFSDFKLLNVFIIIEIY